MVKLLELSSNFSQHEQPTETATALKINRCIIKLTSHLQLNYELEEYYGLQNLSFLYHAFDLTNVVFFLKGELTFIFFHVVQE